MTMLNFKNDFEKEIYALGDEPRIFVDYDPEVRLVKRYRGKNGYCSKLSDCTVHEIRASFYFANQLLTRDSEGYRQIAHDVLYRALPLQDINPARRTYGIWPYYLEESLEEMDVPDMNWADFIGEALLLMLKDHSDKLTDDLKMRMKDAVMHACRCIIKRNVGPEYSNISIMGAFVTMFAGELFDIPEFFEYGKKRLARLHEYNVSNGDFREFNSPTYTFICIEEFTRVVEYIKDEECRRLAAELNDLAWRSIALHYHPTTGQLAGPHDRAYGPFIGQIERYKIERANDYRVCITDHEDIRRRARFFNIFSLNVSCPEKYTKYFETVDGERILDNTFAPGRMAYTYMNKSLTLGSLHAEMAWNQHRNVLGYFGTVERPVSLTIRSQKNDWDYCASYMSTVQDKGRALTTTTFTSDGFDTHCCLDPIKGGRITASDIRVRYVFEGAIDSLDVTEDGDTFVITHKESNVKVKISYPLAEFNGEKVRLEVRREEKLLSVDAVLYSGEEREFILADLKRSFAVSTVEMTDGELSADKATAEIKDGRIVSVYGNLKSSITDSVTPHRKVFDTLYLERDGKEYKPAF